ncbi:MAG: hypothetical protein AAB870_00615 [Patescibacteria group bacterium]
MTHETVPVRQSTIGQIKDLITTLVGAIPALTFDEAQAIIGGKRELIDGVVELFKHLKYNISTPYLTFNKTFKIRACNEIPDLNDLNVSVGNFDPQFVELLKIWDETSTRETIVKLYDLEGDGLINTFLNSLPYYSSRCHLTWSKVLVFIEDHIPKLHVLHDEVLVPFAMGKHYFIAYFHFNAEKNLQVDILESDSNKKWYADTRDHCIVVQV